MTNPSVHNFFELFEKAISTNNINAIGTLYADTFMFGTSDGVQPVKKEGFLSVLPKREGFFAKIGLKQTRLKSVAETKLDESYSFVKTVWTMHYEKQGHPPIEDDTDTTYMLFKRDDMYQIVLQLDHQDLMNRVQTLGLL